MDHLLSMEFNLLETYYVLTIQFEYIIFFNEVYFIILVEICQ